MDCRIIGVEFRITGKAVGAVFAVAMMFGGGLSAATDYYVAVDGDDANSGLSMTEAKATVAAAYTALTNGTPDDVRGNRLVVGEGEFAFPEFTLVLTDGQSIVGTEGKSVLKLPELAQSTAMTCYAGGMIAMAAVDTKIEGITVDFNDVELKLNGALFQNPKGKVVGCTFTGYTKPVYTSMNKCCMVYFNDASCAPEFIHCRFTKGKNPHIGYIVNVDAAASPVFDGCSFTDFIGGHSMGSIGVRNADSATVIRNCLFARCDISWSNKNAVRAQVIYTPNKANATVIDNCTIVDCTAYGWDETDAENDLLPIYGQATVRNTLIYNIKKDDGTPLAYEIGNDRCLKYDHCAADRALDGTDNVLLEEGSVLFDFSEEDDYVALSGAVIDAGAVLDWMEVDSVDVRQSDRQTGSAPDIGCFELKARPKTYYVMADGDDANDGLSAESAKATVAGAYEALTNAAAATEYADSITVGDGAFDLTGYTMTFVNRQRMTSENGPEKTKLLVPSGITESTAYRLFDFASPKTVFRGFTVDYRNKYFSYVNGALALNPQGIVADCVFENCKSMRIRSVYFVNFTEAVSPVFSNCVFRNIHNHYRASVIHVNNSEAAPVFTHCTFKDLTCGGYFSYGTVHADTGAITLRNCLFLRCCNHQDTHQGKYRSATIHANAQTVVENCSLVDCRFEGEAYESEAGAEWAALSGPIIRAGTVVNTLVYGCTNQFGCLVSCKAGPTYSYTAHDAVLDGENNVLLQVGDIRFRKPAKDDYTVVSGATIDAGTTLGWMADATDLKGRPRVIGPAADIGCYEFDPKEFPKMTVFVR